MHNHEDFVVVFRHPGYYNVLMAPLLAVADEKGQPKAYANPTVAKAACREDLHAYGAVPFVQPHPVYQAGPHRGSITHPLVCSN